jgi:hypothetical protein
VRIAARLDFTVQISGLAADAVNTLEHVVVRLDLVPRHAPVLDGGIFREEIFAVARGDL